MDRQVLKSNYLYHIENEARDLCSYSIAHTHFSFLDLPCHVHGLRLTADLYIAFKVTEYYIWPTLVLTAASLMFCSK